VSLGVVGGEVERVSQGRTLEEAAEAECGDQAHAYGR
jgi:hypothetical protein